MSDKYAKMSGAELISLAMADDSESCRGAAQARIEAKTIAVKKALDAGLPLAEFKRLEIVHTALQTSGMVFEQLWPVAKAKREKG